MKFNEENLTSHSIGDNVTSKILFIKSLSKYVFFLNRKFTFNYDNYFIYLIVYVCVCVNVPLRGTTGFISVMSLPILRILLCPVIDATD